MRTIDMSARTVEEAVEAACEALGVDRDDLNVSYEVLEFPARKLFKTIPAKVRVTVEEPEETAAPAAEAPQSTPAPVEEAAPVEEPAPQSVENAEETPAASAVSSGNGGLTYRVRSIYWDYGYEVNEEGNYVLYWDDGSVTVVSPEEWQALEEEGERRSIREHDPLLH